MINSVLGILNLVMLVCLLGAFLITSRYRFAPILGIFVVNVLKIMAMLFFHATFQYILGAWFAVSVVVFIVSILILLLMISGKKIG